MTNLVLFILGCDLAQTRPYKRRVQPRILRTSQFHRGAEGLVNAKPASLTGAAAVKRSNHSSDPRTEVTGTNEYEFGSNFTGERAGTAPTRVQSASGVPLYDRMGSDMDAVHRWCHP